MSGLVARSPFGAGGGGGLCGRDARGSLGAEGRGAVGALASCSAREPQMSVDSLLPLGSRAGTGAAGAGAIGAALAQVGRATTRHASAGLSGSDKPGAIDFRSTDRVRLPKAS